MLVRNTRFFFTLLNLIHYVNHLNVCSKRLKSGYLKRDEVHVNE